MNSTRIEIAVSLLQTNSKQALQIAPRNDVAGVFIIVGTDENYGK